MSTAKATLRVPYEVIDYTPTSNVSRNQVVRVNDLVGVALQDIAANTTGSICLRGVFWMPKATGISINQGAKVYWDSSNNNVTTNSTGTTFCGFCARAAGSSDTQVLVMLWH